MKKIVLSTLVFLLVGCQSLKHAYYDNIYISNTPNNIDEVNVSYDFDPFKENGWLTSSYYMSWFESDTNVIAYKYRALYSSEKATSPQFIQLYFVLKSPDWYFIESIYNENGVKYTVNLIDRGTANAGNVYEYFAIQLNKKQLDELSSSDLRLKIVGKKGTETFSVSSLVAQSFRANLEKRAELIK
ncbi:hypothetical protein ACUYO1_003333 [Vibrio vulnificus]